jgi:hypothetical protein
MANYANSVSAEKKLGIRFQAILPRQMVGGTGVGDAAAAAYGAKLGVTTSQYLARSGAPMPPRQFGEHLVTLLSSPQYDADLAFGLKGDTGITVLERASA